ncbi:MAG: hypothetical protein GC180_12830 [Bacteroidetes bacterium]|nr:hypothetical protein [Bacteroidota bacterium]
MKLGMILLIALSAFGCNDKKYKPEEWIRYVQSDESGLKREVTVGECRMEVQYYPPSYWKAKALLEGKTYTGTQDSFARFKVYFSTPEKTKSLAHSIANNREEYTRILEYLDGDARYDFLFKQGADTNLTAMYHYERTYDLVPFDCINLAFPFSADRDDAFVIEYHDNMFCFGIQKFLFNEKTLKKVNHIEFISQCGVSAQSDPVVPRQ